MSSFERKAIRRWQKQWIQNRLRNKSEAGFSFVKAAEEILKLTGRRNCGIMAEIQKFRGDKMSFQLKSVVPWGRNLQEYRMMFQLTDEDMEKKIAGFGDGPASFNYEATQEGHTVLSFDPIYQFSAEELRKRIEEVRTIVMQQMKENMENYVWKNIRNLEELEDVRMSAMRLFLSDFEKGKREGRYICHALPERLPYENGAFDIGLSSHFLLMYTALGYDFHIGAITEMLRVCKEIRIFPIVDLDANKTELAAKVMEHFKAFCEVEIKPTEYEFQKGDNKVLVIKS